MLASFARVPPDKPRLRSLDPDEVAPRLAGDGKVGCVSARVRCARFGGTQMMRCRRDGVVLGTVRFSTIILIIAPFPVNGGVCCGGESSNRYSLAVN